MRMSELQQYYKDCEEMNIEPTREGLSHYSKMNILISRVEAQAEIMAEEKWSARDAKDIPFTGNRLCKDALNDYCMLCKRNNTEPNFEDAYKLQTSLYSA